MSIKYDVMSPTAEEFINDEEIQKTLEFAEENKHNEKLMKSLKKQGRKKVLLTERLRHCLTAISKKRMKRYSSLLRK